MVYSIQKLPDEPIIIDTHSEPMEAIGYVNFATELSDVANSIQGPIYRISDLRDMTFSFPTLVHVLAEETKSGRPGSAGDPRVNLVLVAVDLVADLIKSSAQQKQYGGRNFPIFDTVDAALAHVRKQIKG